MVHATEDNEKLIMPMQSYLQGSYIYSKSQIKALFKHLPDAFSSFSCTLQLW